MDKSIYTIQWVESGLEIELPDGGDEDIQLEKSVYLAGAERWFTLFYNSSTPKFVDYFEKLIAFERRTSLQFP